MINRNLIRTINSGDCVLFVGSGASCSAGLPSWKSLVEQLISQIPDDLTDIENGHFERVKSKFKIGDMIKALDSIEQIIGRKGLEEKIAEIFSNATKNDTEVYKILASWPFKFFMTTNYDSLLIEYLEENEIPAIEKGNSEEEFVTIHSSVRNIVYKIHGDFSNPSTMVITSKDYAKLCSAEEFAYWREKMRAVFHMVPILIVGYSAEDPDFREQLEYAKEFADPKQPIYMIVADLSTKETLELLEQNIMVIPYDNGDGTHNGLTRLLKLYSSFIQRRDDPFLGKEEVNSEKAEIASSLYFYNELLKNDSTSVIERAFCNVILKICFDEQTELSIDLLGVRLKQNGIASETAVIHDALMQLISQGLLKENLSTKTFSIQDLGSKILQDNLSVNRVKKDQFIRYCTLYLQSRNKFEYNQIEKILSVLDRGITAVFRFRGFEIAQKLLSNDCVTMSSSTDLLGELNKFATDKVLSSNEYIGFIELILDLFEHPSREAQEYFGDLVNGYFLYHVLGQKTEARKIRLKEIQNRDIYIDSSILISILANGFINYDISNDLIRLIDKNGIRMCYTDKLLAEVVSHADWALRNYGNDGPDSLQFCNAAFGSSTRNNLFVDGFLTWSIGRGPIKFKDYLKEILEFNYSYEIEKSVDKLLMQKNIKKLSLSDVHGIFYEEDVCKLETQTERVTEKRKAMKTYKNPEQCKTEAELMMISEISPINFLTRSKSLVELVERDQLNNWLPEVLFRFLALNDTDLSPVSLNKCMYGDFIAAGFNVIEKDDVKKIINPLFNQARADISHQINVFGDVLSTYVTEEIIATHEEDYSLPMFAKQTAFYAAKKQKELLDAKDEIIRGLSSLKSLSNKERTEYARLKTREEQRKKKHENKRKGKKKKQRRK